MKKILFIIALTILAMAAFAESVAVIDMDVISKSEYITNAMKSLESQAIAIQKELQIRQENRFLGENEINELLNLVNANGDKDKIKAFQDTHQKRYDELQLLNQTKELTDEQKARMTELNNLVKKSGENFENRQKVLTESLHEADAKNSEIIMNALKAACEKVAKSKKIDIVIDKIDVYYGGVDITKDVINALPKPEKKK